MILLIFTNSFWVDFYHFQTCIVGLSQHDYFAKGIKLIQSMRLTEHFKEAGVIPSDSDSNPCKHSENYHTISYSSVTYYEDKLRSTFGFTPSFECEGFHRNGLFGMGLSTKPVAISDAYFCANKNWELFECPDSVREHVRGPNVKKSSAFDIIPFFQF